MKLYPEYNLTSDKLVRIGWASSLHDIGKIAIPDNIILKAGKLTPDESELIKSHTTKGAEIIQSAIRLNDKEIYDYAYDIARHHHERYDGKGYPDGLKEMKSVLQHRLFRWWIYMKNSLQNVSIKLRMNRIKPVR